MKARMVWRNPKTGRYEGGMWFDVAAPDRQVTLLGWQQISEYEIGDPTWIEWRERV